MWVVGANVFCLFIPSLRDACVPNYVIQSNVAACLHTFCSKEKGHACNALHSVPPLVKNEPLCAESTFVIEEEAKRWKR